jgi:hypothetical protein
MRKFYSEPTMDVNVFDVENIVTESTGTPTDVADITDGYAKVQVGYSELNIVF